MKNQQKYTSKHIKKWSYFRLFAMIGFAFTSMIFALPIYLVWVSFFEGGKELTWHHYATLGSLITSMVVLYLFSVGLSIFTTYKLRMYLSKVESNAQYKKSFIFGYLTSPVFLLSIIYHVIYLIPTVADHAPEGDSVNEKEAEADLENDDKDETSRNSRSEIKDIEETSEKNLPNKTSFIKRILNSNLLRLNTFEIALSGILLGIFLIVSVITHYTYLGKIGLNFEYIFYIIFAFFFRYFKGAFLAFIGDFISLMFQGAGIASWHWVYAIVPVLIVIVSSLFFDLVRINKKHALILGNIFVIASFSAIITVVFKQIAKKGGSPLKISSIFSFKTIDVTTLYILIALAIVIVIGTIFVSIYSIWKNKPRLSYFAIAFIIVTIVVVIGRWLWGPYAYIQYKQFWLKDPLINLWDRYVTIMLPIIIKGLIVIPIYSIILGSLIFPMTYLYNRYIAKNKINAY
ncbi:Uncharacterised protein [Mycoplasmopsis gallinacea]|uniref:ECF transporter S component n=2 Tax=Mycoplasmopsis gallinacea TaxID=29556 RepID=A0A449A1Y5_9BACT|nr:Uncharacterised protein [Mycoplasmopsis gallinacea]